MTQFFFPGLIKISKMDCSMALKTKICLTPFRRSLFLFSHGVIHFALRFLYSLDLFGSFLGQVFPEHLSESGFTLFYSGPKMNRKEKKGKRPLSRLN
jgi:hypothetical protein